MAFTDNDHVLTCEGIIIWEALVKPDIKEHSQAQNWNVRIACDPAAPEVQELRQLRDKALRESKIPTVNPQTPGNDPISDIDRAKFPEIPPHYVCFTAGTIQGCPEIWYQGKKLESSMQYAPMLYNGCKVRLLVHAYPYDKKQKGINFGLDGVEILDPKAPRLSIGAVGLSQAAIAAVFGGSPAPAAPAPAPAPQAAPPAPNTTYMAPPPPPAAVQFPPEGWLAHPSAPGYFYKGQEVKSEADLRAAVGA